MTALGWISREIWRWRKAKRLATEDATKTLNQKKALLEEIISKAEDPNDKNNLVAQLEEVNAVLLGLYAERLRRTLKSAGLPPEEALIADGLSQLRPEETTRIKGLIKEVETLPLRLSTHDLFILGSAYFYTERYEQAKNVCDRILSLNPNDSLALNNRGIIYGQLGRYDLALDDLNRVLELNSDDANAFYNRGVVYALLKTYKKALADFNRSLKIKPDDLAALTNRGTTYAHLEEYEKALADFNRLLEIGPNNPAVLNNRGNTYKKLERYEEALADYNHSIELRPDDPHTLSNRGGIYAKLERYKEALADYNRSLELSPDDPDTLYNLACLSSLLGKADDALSYLEKAIDKDQKYREMAKTDKDFDNIRDDPRFKKLIESD